MESVYCLNMFKTKQPNNKIGKVNESNSFSCKLMCNIFTFVIESKIKFTFY